MKLATQNISVIMAVLVVVTAGSTFAINEAYDNSVTSEKLNGMAMTGNVKVTQTDENGNIIAYRQSDNHIVKTGLELIVGQVFNGMNETMPDQQTRPVSHIEIGTDGEWRVLHNNTDIYAPVGGACVRQPITVTNVSAATTGSEQAPTSCVEPNCAAQYNVTATATFLGNDCNPAQDIDEAGIFNDVAAGLMFARNTFGGVVLLPGDSLALDWEFTFTDALP